MKKAIWYKSVAAFLAACVVMSATLATVFASEPAAPAGQAEKGAVVMKNDPEVSEADSGSEGKGPEDSENPPAEEDTKPAAPELTGKAKDYRTVVLSWDNVDGAAGYEVFVGDDSAGTTTNTTYEYKNAIPTVKASYTVKAYREDATGNRICSDASNVVEITTALNTPKVKTAVVTSSKKIKMTWDKVAGATGYEVFVGGKSVAATKSASCTYTSSKTKTLTWGKKYDVQVRAYYTTGGEKYYSAKSAAKSLTMRPAAVTIKSAKSAAYNSVKVTWKKLSGASGYYVYRKTGSGKYKKIATVSGGSKVSYTDKKASLGKTFTYKVCAYWKSGKKEQAGAYSGEKSAKTALNTPTLLKPEYGKTQIEVNWKKVPGASGYYVYRKTSAKAAWKKIATVKGGSKVTYVDKKVKKNKKYYYTVAAYRKSGKKTYKSSYSKKGKSAILKIRIKEKVVKDKKSQMYGKKIRLYVNADGSVIQDVESIIGKRSSYQIYVNKAKNQVTVYAKDGKVYIPVKSFVCTVGKASTPTPTGTFTTKYKYRWQEMMGPTWGQWVTRITWDGVLFHSVYYNSQNNNNNLSVSAYNCLGGSASHGCVRLTAGDAKWIYDNCKVGTKVVIYSKSGYEPLKKPKAYKLPSWHTWDPTDPNMKYKCKKRGCH